MGQREADLRAAGATLLAAAVTATFSQQAFAASLGVDFPLLSDWEREVCASFGVRYRSWKGHAGLAKRSIFVVAPDRTVRYRWFSDDASVLPDVDGVVEAVRGIR